MPIYEYKCDDCDTLFEALVMGSAAEPDTCDCGSGAIEKVYSRFAAGSSEPSPDACATPAAERCGAPACMGGMCGMN
ncbi:MAG: zinc ribbon domain-containing protein [Bryobacterales bacterium]|nr:zinc ribbon domain-containing protein [Bryobacterales bacterium]